MNVRSEIAEYNSAAREESVVTGNGSAQRAALRYTARHKCFRILLWRPVYDRRSELIGCRLEFPHIQHHPGAERARPSSSEVGSR
jgi:hypothetical protein